EPKSVVIDCAPAEERNAHEMAATARVANVLNIVFDLVFIESFSSGLSQLLVRSCLERSVF
ncbi:MAG: hypothetical protein ACREP1_13110, partial [Rhodanobacteraceae bacterium]